MKRSILFASVLACLAVAGCKGKGDFAATVNGETISKDEFYRYMSLKRSVKVMVDPSKLTASSAGPIPAQMYDGQVATTIGLQAMSDMVQQVVLMQLAKDENVVPTKAEIDSEMEDRKATNPGFLKQSIDAGLTTDMIQKSLATELAQVKLTTQGITISDSEVDTYIATHPKEFVSPEMVDLIWILAPDDKKKQDADSALKTGESFIMVAQKYSSAPRASEAQYRYPVSVVSQLGTPLDALIKKTAVSKQTDWLRIPEGWAKFYVNKKEPERKVGITDIIKRRVKRGLALQRGMQARDLGRRVQEKLKAAKIEIGIDYLKEPWKNAMEGLIKEQGAAPAPAANP